MKKANITKKALIASIVSMLLCCTMLIGSTYAWFTDSAASGTNKIVAGNLDIELNILKNGKYVDATTVNGAFGVDLWEPGVVASETFQVVNAGNLALKYNMYFSVLSMNTVNGKSLADVIKVAVIAGEVDTTDRAELIAAIEGDLQDITDTGAVVTDGTLLPMDKKGKGNTSVYTVVAYWAPTDSDNDYNLNNGKVADNGEDTLYINFGIILSATQYTYENDSFDDKYDEGADYDIHPVVVETINQGAKDANAAILEAIKEIGGEEATQKVYFDEGGLVKNDDGEWAITLHFEEDSSRYADVTYQAVKSLIGKAVLANSASIESISIEGLPARTSADFDEEGQWVEDDLRTIIQYIKNTSGITGSGITGALEIAKEKGLSVVIKTIDGVEQTYRMNFDIHENWGI